MYLVQVFLFSDFFKDLYRFLKTSRGFFIFRFFLKTSTGFYESVESLESIHEKPLKIFNKSINITKQRFLEILQLIGSKYK